MLQLTWSKQHEGKMKRNSFGAGVFPYASEGPRLFSVWRRINGTWRLSWIYECSYITTGFFFFSQGQTTLSLCIQWRYGGTGNKMIKHAAGWGYVKWMTFGWLMRPKHRCILTVVNQMTTDESSQFAKLLILQGECSLGRSCYFMLPSRDKNRLRRT